MTKGGRRSTTWESPWKIGTVTKVIRVPEAISDEVLRLAKALHEGELPPVTGNKLIEKEALQEKAEAFLMTIRPTERKEAGRILRKFLKSLED